MDSSNYRKSVIIVVVFAITMLMAMYSTLAERRLPLGFKTEWPLIEQVRRGLLQPLADGLKLFSKEEFEPEYTTDSYSSLDQQCNEYCTHDKRCNSLG
jgi:NADH-quinone oxidoreductase subunit H